MNKTDVTPEQIEHARNFLLEVTLRSGEELSDDTRLTFSLDFLSHLIARYSALRYLAGKNGSGGTLEKPDQLVRNVCTCWDGYEIGSDRHGDAKCPVHGGVA